MTKYRALSLDERDELCVTIGFLEGLCAELGDSNTVFIRSSIKFLHERLTEDDEHKYREVSPGVFEEREDSQMNTNPTFERANIKFDYGDIVSDCITGYTGKVTAYAHYYGKEPDRYQVEGIDTTGRPISDWYEAHRLSYCMERGAEK